MRSPGRRGPPGAHPHPAVDRRRAEPDRRPRRLRRTGEPGRARRRLSDLRRLRGGGPTHRAPALALPAPQRLRSIGKDLPVPTTMLVVEKAITQHDLDYIVALHAENADDGLAPENYVVVVPVGKENGKVLATLDDLALGNFKGAEEDSHDEPLNEAVVEARAAMTATVEAFRHAGKQAAGELLVGQPVDGLKAIAAKYGVDEIIVLTVPHL